MHHRIGVVALTLAFGCLLLTGCASSGARSVRPSLPTPTIPVVAATMTPPSADPTAQGWARQGPQFVDQIQQAPSAPNTLYACGGPPAANSGLGFSVSQDGGKTWQTWATSIQASACLSLRVSPTAPQAVAVYSATCRAECGMGEFYLHYSLDGGKHWTKVFTSGVSTTVGTYGWVGTAFFANGAPSGTPASATENLAVSTNGGPFSWTNLPYSSGALFSTATTVYVQAHNGLYSSTNLGASWSNVTPAYQGHAVNPTALVPGASLLGYDARSANGPNIYPLLHSSDGGATWQALPSFPAGMQANGDATETPDGTIYVTCFGSDSAPVQVGIYKLTPSTTQWTLISPIAPGSLFLHVVTWDANGHPVTIWGLQETLAYTYIPWTHTA